MFTNRRQILRGLALGTLALGLVAGPVSAAGAPVQSSWSDSYTVQHDCGVVEATTMTIHEKAFFTGNTYVRSVVQADFDGIYSGPTGKTYAVETHQNGVFTPDVARTSGQVSSCVVPAGSCSWMPVTSSSTSLTARRSRRAPTQFAGTTRRPRATSTLRSAPGSADARQAYTRRTTRPTRATGPGPRPGPVDFVHGRPTAKRGSGSGVSGKGKTVHGEAANAGHRVLAPDDAEVEAYLEVALDAPAPDARPTTSRGQPTRHRRRPRLRQPVRAAHRPPRPRAERLLRAAAVRHAAGRDRAPRRERRHPVRRPELGLRRRRAQARPADLERPPAGPGHLLRRAADGHRPRRRRASRPTKREYGPATVTITERRRPVPGHRPEQPVWMSHGDSITAPAPGLPATAQTDSTPYAGLADPARHLYGIQFHPEVVPHAARARHAAQLRPRHCRRSRRRGRRRASSTRPSPRSATGRRARRASARTARSSARSPGGVDSAVAAALVHRAVGDRLTCIYVDHGLMRKRESELLRATFEQNLGMNLVMVDARERFLARLAGVDDPEQKRRIIGDEFIRVFEEEAGQARARSTS